MQFIFCKTSIINGFLSPILPMSCDYNLLVSCDHQPAFGLYAVSPRNELKASTSWTPVDSHLKELLKSSYGYPPSLASAIHETRTDLSINDIHSLSSKLKYNLSKFMVFQRDAKHCLIQSKKDEIGYMDNGDFVWVVNYDKINQEVVWVSRDFYFYKNSIHDFEVEHEWLSSRFRDL